MGSHMDMHTCSECGTQKRGYTGVHIFFAKLCELSRADMGIQADMHTHTDACIHSNQDVEVDEG